MATTKRKSLAQSLHVLTGGDEPQINKDNYRETLMRALNWYNANREEKDFRSYAEYYVKQSPDLKEYAYAVSKASLLEVKSIGVIGRLVRREQYVHINETMKVLEALEQLKAKYKKQPVKKHETTATVAPSIQDRILETARTHAAEVDAQIDIFTTEKSNSFSMKSYLIGNSVSGVIAKKIGSFYEPLAKELEEAYKGKDAQLKEGYSNLSKVQLRKFLEFVQQIIADCNQQVVSAKAQRKPRTKKTKPPSVIVKKIKYMKECAELNLKSIDPAKIIGASELWVYHPVKRKLTVFRGADGGFLSVSGMSITNYDVEKSETKTIRKPDAFFKGLSSYGKRAMVNAWKAINATPSSPRGRINEEMILLAVN